MEFPRLVYRAATDHIAVNSREEYDAAIADGWFGSVPEAKAGKHAVPEHTTDDDTLPPTRVELETQARELNLKFDGRNSDATLLKMIADALKS